MCRFDGRADTGHRGGSWTLHLHSRNVRHSKVRQTVSCLDVYVIHFPLKLLKEYTLYMCKNGRACDVSQKTPVNFIFASNFRSCTVLIRKALYTNTLTMLSLYVMKFGRFDVISNLAM